jgi:hypothetical protein
MSLFSAARIGSCLVLALPLFFESSEGSAWSSSGPRWTREQARIALITTPRIIAHEADEPNAEGLTYMFAVIEVRSIRPVGQPVRVGRTQKWLRFKVNVLAQPIAGRWDRDFPIARFCLHPLSSRIRTTYPYSRFRLTGFEHELAVWGGPSQGCRDTPKARDASGGPLR